MANSMPKQILLPKRPTYELTKEYLLSKSVTRSIPRPLICGDDISERNVNTTNFLARQKLRKTEKLLGKKRRSSVDKRKELDNQWDHISKTEDDLRQMFINFSQFIAENSDKRARAAQEVANSRTITVSREEQIKTTTQEFEALLDIKTRMGDQVIANKIFKNYLNSVVEKFPDEFQSIHDILRRYDVLSMAGKEVMHSQLNDAEQLSELKREFGKLVDGYVVEISGMTTRVAQLQQRHDEARRRCKQWEELHERIRATATERIIDTVAIKESCWRIYQEMCKRKGVEPVFRDDLAKQLDVIKRTLWDYRCINDMARKAEAEVSYASEIACASKEAV